MSKGLKICFIEWPEETLESKDKSRGKVSPA
jgi:hypothetical protein